MIGYPDGVENGIIRELRHAHRIIESAGRHSHLDLNGQPYPELYFHLPSPSIVKYLIYGIAHIIFHNFLRQSTGNHRLCLTWEGIATGMPPRWRTAGCGIN